MKHFNNLTPAQAERLAILAEECGEVIQAVNKILRHGYDSKHPTAILARTNRQDLELEVGDLELALELMYTGRDLCRDSVSQAYLEKGNRLGQYLHHNKCILQETIT